jgi:hypothetical protein
MTLNLNFSPAAWILLACIFGLVVWSALYLFSAWKGAHRPRRPGSSPPPSPGLSFTRSWEKEDEQVDELAKRVKELQNRQK